VTRLSADVKEVRSSLPQTAVVCWHHLFIRLDVTSSGVWRMWFKQFQQPSYGATDGWLKILHPNPRTYCHHIMDTQSVTSDILAVS